MILSFLYPFIGLTSLIYTSLAGTPARYPFDRPVFGGAQCDNSLPNPPKLNRSLREEAERKLSETGLNGKPRTADSLLQLHLFKETNIGPVVASADPKPDGVLPVRLFQYWDRPFLYQVYASGPTSQTVDKDDPAMGKLVNNLAFDIMNTCCKFGYSGTMFGRNSDNHGDYIEVYILYSEHRPAGNPFEPEDRLSWDFDGQPASAPRRSRNPFSRGSMEESASNVQLIRTSPHPFELPDDIINDAIWNTALSNLPVPELDDVPGTAKGSSAGSNAQNPPSGHSAGSPAGSIAQLPPTRLSAGSPAQFGPADNSTHVAMSAPDLQILIRELRECREAVQEMNVRGQAHDETREMALRDQDRDPHDNIREYSGNRCSRWCQKAKDNAEVCGAKAADCANENQALFGMCICCLFTITAPFGIYGAFN